MSSGSIPAITAFVEATAGMIRLTTPVNTKHTMMLGKDRAVSTEGCTQRH